MVEYTWLERWERGDISFHLSTVNPLLEKYWPQLKTNAQTVLVPLCGKTLDLLWFTKHGYHVIGVELSEIACEAFFIENKLNFNKQKKDGFTRYYNKQIDIYCGDFFNLSSEMIPPVLAVYDRAALIALPDNLRYSYADHLTQLMGLNGQILLIVLESPDKVQGPPYSLSFNNIKQLFGKHFQISELTRFREAKVSKHLCDKGYNEIYDVVYSLKKIKI